jgi:hypothetical protein
VVYENVPLLLELGAASLITALQQKSSKNRTLKGKSFFHGLCQKNKQNPCCQFCRACRTASKSKSSRRTDFDLVKTNLCRKDAVHCEEKKGFS